MISSFTIPYSLSLAEATRRLSSVIFRQVNYNLGDNMTDLRQKWDDARRCTIQFQAMGKPVTVCVSLLDGSRVKFDLYTVQEMGIILPYIKEEICRQAEIFLN